MLAPSALGLRIHRAKFGNTFSNYNFGCLFCYFLLYSVWTCNILANSLLFVCFNKFFYFDNSGEHYKLVLKIKYHKNEKIKQVMHLS